MSIPKIGDPKISNRIRYAEDASHSRAGKIGKIAWVTKLPFSPPAWGYMIEWEDGWPLSVGVSSRVLEGVVEPPHPVEIGPRSSRLLRQAPPLADPTPLMRFGARQTDPVAPINLPLFDFLP